MKNDSNTTIANLSDKIHQFAKSRGFLEGQNAKDLAISLSLEASELLEIFQWVHSDHANNINNNPKEFEHLQEEIADVLWYLLRICNLLQIDLTAALYDKAEKNAKRFPEINPPDISPNVKS